jgi:hypothetical protein
MSREFFDAVVLGRLCEKWRNKCNSPHVFVSKKYASFSSIRICSSPVCHKIFPESYEFAVKRTPTLTQSQ